MELIVNVQPWTRIQRALHARSSHNFLVKLLDNYAKCMQWKILDSFRKLTYLRLIQIFGNFLRDFQLRKKITCSVPVTRHGLQEVKAESLHSDILELSWHYFHGNINSWKVVSWHFIKEKYNKFRQWRGFIALAESCITILEWDMSCSLISNGMMISQCAKY